MTFDLFWPEFMYCLRVSFVCYMLACTLNDITKKLRNSNDHFLLNLKAYNNKFCVRYYLNDIPKITYRVEFTRLHSNCKFSSEIHNAEFIISKNTYFAKYPN